MAPSRRFRVSVVGEGRVRHSGVLADVLPRALDLVSQSTYVVSLCEATDPPPGRVYLRRAESGVTAVYQPNPNVPKRGEPDWLDGVDTVAQTIGRTITWTSQS